MVENYKKYNPKHKAELVRELDKQMKRRINDSDIKNIECDKNLKVNEMEFEDKDLKKMTEKVKKQ